MEVLQRLGAQAPAERGYDNQTNQGSKAPRHNTGARRPAEYSLDNQIGAGW